MDRKNVAAEEVTPGNKLKNKNKIEIEIFFGEESTSSHMPNGFYDLPDELQSHIFRLSWRPSPEELTQKCDDRRYWRWFYADALVEGSKVWESGTVWRPFVCLRTLTITRPL